MSRRKGSDPNPSGSFWDKLYPTLDLHGLSGDEAVSKAGAWLERSRAEGEPTVRLITGRGLHSAGPPVLPGAIEGLLAELKGIVIRSFEREPGGGAYRVTLAQAQSAPIPPAASKSLDRHDAALVRQAEEALADLGISPTPALIEAEIRQMIKERGGKPK